jgi:hypothetical protein
MFHSEIVNNFLSHQVGERFLTSYVLDCFQSASEYSNGYTTAVVMAADISGSGGPEFQLVHRMLQHLHPRVKCHLLFATKPESVQDLLAIAMTVAEAVAVEEQHKSLSTAARQGEAPCSSVSSVVMAGYLWPGPIVE